MVTNWFEDKTKQTKESLPWLRIEDDGWSKNCFIINVVLRYSRWRCLLVPAAVELLYCYRTVHEPAPGPVPSTTNWIVDFSKCSRHRPLLHHEQLADLCVCSRLGWYRGFWLLDVVSDRSWRTQAERASQGEWNILNGTFFLQVCPLSMSKTYGYCWF